MAALGSEVPTVYFDEHARAPGGFVLQLTDQLTPTHVTDALGQRRIADQVLDGQRLYAYRLVFTNEACRQLVPAIGAWVGKLRVETSDLQARLLSVLGPALFAGAVALHMH